MDFRDLVTNCQNLDEKDYGEIKAKQRSITSLFPTFYDRVKRVASKGGVRIAGVDKKEQGDEWKFNVTSATRDGISYENVVKFRDIDSCIKQHALDKRTWKRDGSGVDYRLLASEVLYDCDMELLCTCPAFLYWGSAYILTQRQAKWTNPEDRRPKIRNPKEYGAMCKHMQLVFDVLPFYSQTMSKYIKAYYDSVVAQAEEEVRRQEQTKSDQEKTEGEVEGQEPEAPEGGEEMPPRPEGEWESPFESVQALVRRNPLDESIKTARRTYVKTNRISEDEFQQLLEKDPTDTKKYIDWICTMYVDSPRGNRTGEKDLDRYDVVKKFNDIISRNIVGGPEADITRYLNLDQLDALVARHGGRFTKSQIKKGIKKGKEYTGIKPEDIVAENELCIVVHPRTEETAALYGRGAHWCTAVQPGSGRGNLFKSQTQDHSGNEINPLYYILPKIELGELMGLPPVNEEDKDDPNRKYEKVAVRAIYEHPKELRDFFNVLISEADFKKIRDILRIP